MLIITMLIKITMFIIADVWQMQDLPVDVVGVDIF